MVGGVDEPERSTALRSWPSVMPDRGAATPEPDGVIAEEPGVVAPSECSAADPAAGAEREDGQGATQPIASMRRRFVGGTQEPSMNRTSALINARLRMVACLLWRTQRYRRVHASYSGEPWPLWRVAENKR